MPEGHTIHRLAERHRALFVGHRITASSPQGRFAAGAEAVSGAVLRDTEAYGKHLLHHYDGRSVHIHLGLYGVFTEGSGVAEPPVGQVRLRMTTRRHWLDLRGAASCELFTPGHVAALRARLGPDPLRDDADPTVAYERLHGRATAVAALLMDQSIVAGAGLVYVSEVLFRAGIAPTRTGRSVGRDDFHALWTDLVELMKEGVERGRIDTVHTRHLPESMGRAPRVDRHGGEVYVYRRHGQPCLICGSPIHQSTLAGRNSYWCPTCQPGSTDR